MATNETAPQTPATTTQAAPSAEGTTTQAATSTPSAPSSWSSWADVETHPSYATLDEGVRSFWKSGAETLTKSAAESKAEAERYLQLLVEANPDFGEYRKRAEEGDSFKAKYTEREAEVNALKTELAAAKASGASAAELEDIKAELAAAKKERETEAATLKKSHEEALNDSYLDAASLIYDAIADAYPQLVKEVTDAEGNLTLEWASAAARATARDLIFNKERRLPSIASVMKEMSKLVAQPEKPSIQAATSHVGSGGAGGALPSGVDAEAAAIANNPRLTTAQKGDAMDQLALKHGLSRKAKDRLMVHLYPDLKNFL